MHALGPGDDRRDERLLGGTNDPAERQWAARFRVRPWMLVVGVALGLGALEATQISLGEAAGGTALTLRQTLFTITSWLWLAALVPGVLLLVRRFPLAGRGRGRNWLVHGVGAVVFAVLHLSGSAVIQRINHPESGFGGTLIFQFQFYFVLDLLVYGAIAGLYLAWRFRRVAAERERDAAVLEARLGEARLAALRGQLSPHFLYNTLNTISTMALRGEQRAVAESLGRLGELLRASLDPEAAEIPLARELEVLDHYLEIQRARFSDRLQVNRQIEPSVLDALVPALLLQPLVENAIEHGLGRRIGACRVSVGARREGETVVLEVIDTGPGFPGSGEPRNDGIGLANTRGRLEAMYGSDADLELGSTEAGGGRVRIVLPFREDDPAGRAIRTPHRAAVHRAGA